MLMMGIETSCDETAAALVEDGAVLSNVIASQIDLHASFGGVVPEIASRKHVEAIGYVIKEAFETGRRTPSQIDGIAVSARYGLIGSLIVGVSAAKSLAYALGVPLVGTHHIEGHIFAPILSHPDIPMPHVCLTVSGGHTMLVYVKGPCRYEVLGNTLDDAAGEAFDKIAKFLNMGFPGGPAIDRLSLQGNSAAFDLPRPLVRGRSLDFSFSGLKTCVVNMFRGRPPETIPLPDVAASFQEAVVDVLVCKAVRAAERKGVAAISVTGGVSANRRLREAFRETGRRLGLPVFFPLPDLHTDNAAMVAAAGSARLAHGERSGLDLNAVSSAPLESLR